MAHAGLGITTPAVGRNRRPARLDHLKPLVIGGAIDRDVAPSSMLDDFRACSESRTQLPLGVEVHEAVGAWSLGHGAARRHWWRHCPTIRSEGGRSVSPDRFRVRRPMPDLIRWPTHCPGRPLRQALGQDSRWRATVSISELAPRESLRHHASSGHWWANWPGGQSVGERRQGCFGGDSRETRQFEDLSSEDVDVMACDQGRHLISVGAPDGVRGIGANRTCRA